MKHLIEAIIADFQERTLPKVKIRDITLPNITGKINTLIGMRRVGKTYLLYQRIQEQLSQGQAKAGILYINFNVMTFLIYTPYTQWCAIY